MAASIARNVSIQIYELEDCPETWELFFLKKGVEGDSKITAAEEFEQELMAYVKNFNEEEFLPYMTESRKNSF